jgi:hypothetical protein
VVLIITSYILKRCGPNSWYPPPQGWIKLNFDGAYKGNPSRMGVEETLRNHEGHINIILYDFLGPKQTSTMNF